MLPTSSRSRDDRRRADLRTRTPPARS
jgi:hypothetical protein